MGDAVRSALAELAETVEACRACPLGEARTRSVFGAGSPTADLAFVGEAPGFHEDQQGVPFVGAAGNLLTKLIESKLGLTRDDVFIMNVLKCRPPGNRDPHPDEVESCSPYLRRQLELIQPRVLVGLGNFASRLLTGTRSGITRIHGQRFRQRHGILICTFHPAAALRGGNAAAGIEEDFGIIAQALAEQPEPDEASEQLDLFA